MVNVTITNTVIDSEDHLSSQEVVMAAQLKPAP